MKNKTSFALGSLSGFVGLIIILCIIMSQSKDVRDKPDEKQFFSVEYHNTPVRLYLGMPQDSVCALLGEPNDRQYKNRGNKINEIWIYKSDDQYKWLFVKFSDGKLEGVR